MPLSRNQVQFIVKKKGELAPIAGPIQVTLPVDKHPRHVKLTWMLPLPPDETETMLRIQDLVDTIEQASGFGEVEWMDGCGEVRFTVSLELPDPEGMRKRA